MIDGDTIELSGGTKVRYIGIDAPETKHPGKPAEDFGPEATAYNRSLVEGEWVRLEFGTDRLDIYGRLVAHVWTVDSDGDAILVNEEMVRAGYARVAMNSANFKYSSLLYAAEREAMWARRALWGTYQPTKTRSASSGLRAATKSRPSVAENGSYRGQLNENGVPKTVYVRGYRRKDGTYVRSHYRSPPYSNPPAARSYSPGTPGVAENGSYHGQISPATGRPKTIRVRSYYRKDGTYVRGHYRSR